MGRFGHRERKTVALSVVKTCMTDSVEYSENSYDRVPYLSATFRGTHLDTLATLGKLVGLNPPAIAACRVLELGCSNGGNLLPMAYGLPGSEFVGLDLSARQIAMGQALLAELGLTNVTLHQLDLLAVDDQLGQFDYILAHGIYSWVPPAVQEKILAICNRLLTPQGLAYISYNTYPGWHMRGMVREMMLYHVRKMGAAAARVEGARSILNFLIEKVGTPEVANLSATDTAAYSAALRYEQTLLAQYQDSYVYHEHLEDINEPVYFSEFIRRAGQHGLQYISEADFVSAQLTNFSPAVAETIRTLSDDVIEAQQYMDFISNRTFRQTILCRESVTLNRTATPDRLAGMFVASPIQPASAEPEISSMKEESFNSHTGRTLTAAVPIIKAALVHLGANWPNYFSLESLLAAAHERLQPGAPQVHSAKQLAEETQLLSQTLLQCFAQGLAEIHIYPALYRTQIDPRPVASLVARLQARAGAMVANLRHEMVQLDELSRQLIVYLDGTRDRAELFNTLERLAREGLIVVQGADGQPIETETERNILLAETLNRTLQKLAGSALLTG